MLLIFASPLKQAFSSLFEVDRNLQITSPELSRHHHLHFVWCLAPETMHHVGAFRFI